MSRIAKFLGLRMLRAGIIPARVWNQLIDDARSSRIVNVIGGSLNAGPSGTTLEIDKPRPSGPGGALCPKWQIRATADSVPDIQIHSPGTIGGEMPEYDTDSLDLTPPPVIPIPTADGIYHLWWKFQWEPESEEIGDDLWRITTGTLVEPIEVIVTAAASPPANTAPTINQATGAATGNGIHHRRFGAVQRDGASGPLINIVSDYCYSMELLICANTIQLGAT